MILTFAISDKSGLTRGRATVRLDWGNKKWQLDADSGGLWQRIAFSSQGAFEVRGRGAVWFWDLSPATKQPRNTIIVRDAPVGEVDTVHPKGKARLYDPKDAAFKDAIIDWEVSTSPAAASGPALSEHRTRIIQSLLPEVLPCVFPAAFLEKGKLKDPKIQPKRGSPEAKYLLNPFNPLAKGAGTSCYTLPAYVAMKLGRPFRFPATTGLPKEGKRYNAWVYAKDSPSRPKPGDLYALCTGDLKDETITHVGVIVDSTGSIWTTADTGQPMDGYSGKIDVRRPYDDKANALAGEVHDGKAPRPIYGWVDIDLLTK